jgi:hypothetical protein
MSVVLTKRERPDQSRKPTPATWEALRKNAELLLQVAGWLISFSSGV